MQHDVGTECLGAADLGQRRGLGHDDGGMDTHEPGGMGDGLGMISGGGGDDPLGLLFLRQLQDLVECTALLEGTGHLQVVQFEVELATQLLTEHLGMGAGREVDVLLDSRICILNV